MTKIVEAANAMIANPDKITNVILVGDEVFFLYKGKYKWSITEGNSGEYRLFYYPGSSDTIDFLADSARSGWDSDIPMITYSVEDIGTVEAKATFKELYLVTKGKVFGVDEALDDIISDLF